MGAPDVNIPEETIEWATGTRIEKVSPYAAKTFVIFGPVVTTDPIPLGIFLAKSHITDLYCYLDGTATPSVTFSVRYGTDINGTGSEVIVGGLAVTTTTLTTASLIDNGWIDKNDLLWMDVTAKSGTVHSLCVILKYRTRQ